MLLCALFAFVASGRFAYIVQRQQAPAFIVAIASFIPALSIAPVMVKHTAVAISLRSTAIARVNSSFVHSAQLLFFRLCHTANPISAAISTTTVATTPHQNSGMNIIRLLSAVPNSCCFLGCWLSKSQHSHPASVTTAHNTIPHSPNFRVFFKCSFTAAKRTRFQLHAVNLPSAHSPPRLADAGSRQCLRACNNGPSRSKGRSARRHKHLLQHSLHDCRLP